ncbi:RNA recognition motif domain-containing protein [Litorilituus lipolyticus]|uniref:RNA-binding protein n=1 Tax=Litorilituus lipolyticus TaxID=2491017 RepID=A0A502KV63_9GAMM|nr:RNA-binding protein [Litorilituus lipolyticus]TPH15528.1 RNA-binding protein [Litorilituus lipolyticus]
MKSPQILTVIIAAVFALISYIISTSIAITPLLVAVFVFVSAIVATLISSNSRTNDASDSNDSNEEIKTLYVGNLPYRANEAVVRELFSEHGTVQSVRLMKDKHTGKRRGFGFVEMAASDLDNAISALNDTEFQQRTLKVREAKERPERTDNN